MTMTEQETQTYYFRCICFTSTDYARRYIPKASLATLKRCLEEIKDRKYSKTLRTMIERRIRQMEREAPQPAFVSSGEPYKTP